MKWVFTRVLLPLVLLVAGIACAGMLTMARPAAGRKAHQEEVLQVEVVRAQVSQEPIMVRGTGVVSPAREVIVSPELGGRVSWVDPSLVAGSRVAKGQVLARLDDRNASFLVRQRQAAVQQAELELALEQQRGQVASREWSLLGQQGTAPALAQRTPQLEAVRMSADSARAALELAQLDLERTKIRAPFDALVVQETAEIGQVVGAGARLFDLIGVDEARVSVPVLIERVAMLEVPGLGAGGASRAVITQRLADGQEIEREGVVLSLGPKLDSSTRTATVVVSIPRPFDGEGLPLLPGAFVDVALFGRSQQVVALPREAVAGEEVVWLAGEGDKLERREVLPLWGDDDHLYLSQGVEDGDRVVVSPLGYPVVGTSVSATEAPREDVQER
ncbi:MAG: efflux RND transporter periplasmic adaptor subunit [Deltaproteobacteria bacterium]|nr:efflux RND transporter periplasmic adaptor subunit [Deltaproteobacteria bacterium]